MTYEYQNSHLQSIFRLTEDNALLSHLDADSSRLINIFWNRNDVPVLIYIDGIPIELQPQQLTTSTYFQQVDLPSSSAVVTTFSFNREFYCVSDHDHEVSCNGIIFFGAQDIPLISLNAEEARKFDLLYQVFLDEFTTHDNIQGEMLIMLLKRLIIKITRLAKSQLSITGLSNQQIDVVRRFHVLVDRHFKTHKRVSEYADMLHKSSKTLSNIFSKYHGQSPLQMIHERIIMEAKRLLRYSDLSSKEVAYELGFEEVASFNKMFKKITNQTPLTFKKSKKEADREISPSFRENLTT